MARARASALPTGSQSLPLDLLCCPRCGGTLGAAAGLACTSCGTQYPAIAGIAWLFGEPDGALAEWRARCRAFITELEAQAGRYRSALTDEVRRPATRNRLKLLANACSDHARRVAALLAPLDVAARSSAPEVYGALAPSLPSRQGPASYYANLHRDWCWGDAENAASLDAVDAALDDHPVARLLVLGAGGGRLAYDLHQRRRPAITVAADINPLLLLVARRMFDGGAIDLYEFPVAPRDLASHAVLRTLRAPTTAPPGLHPVFADVSCAPFATGAFDAVITPWLIDILDEDLATLVRRINGWLKPGGRWINSGTLFFQGPDAPRSYSAEEVREIVAEAGFEVLRWREAPAAYLASPASRHSRVETVVTFAAAKTAAVARPGPRRAAFAWLERSDVPVPLLPEVSSRVLAMRVSAFVASLVDGRRTLADIAAVLAQERLMRADEAEPVVRGFLQRIFDEAREPWRP